MNMDIHRLRELAGQNVAEDQNTVRMDIGTINRLSQEYDTTANELTQILDSNSLHESDFYEFFEYDDAKEFYDEIDQFRDALTMAQIHAEAASELVTELIKKLPKKKR